MPVPSTRVVATFAGLALAASGVAACGSGSGSTSTGSSASASQQQGGQRSGAFNDPKVQACLKKQGVTVPNFRLGGNGPPNGGNGQPPNGGNGQPPSGSSGQRRNRDPAQFQKLRQALQKCGVTLPDRGQNAPPPSGTTNSQTSAS
jgi:hypothetical protein